MITKAIDGRDTKAMDGIGEKTFHEINAKTICLIIGFLCVFLVTFYMEYKEMNNLPIQAQQNSTTVQKVAVYSPAWTAVSRIGLFMHPIRDCYDSLNARKEIPNYK